MPESGDGDKHREPAMSRDGRDLRRIHVSAADPFPETLRAKALHWGALWGLPGLADSVTVEFSTRMRVSLGLCRPTQNRIRLSALLRNGHAELLEEVFCHELAHVAVHRVHGRQAKPHGPEWRALMEKAGFEPKVRVAEDDPRLPADFNKPRTRWEHRCPVCGVRHLAGRPVRRWRCVRCRKAGRSGKLEIKKVMPPG